MQILFIFLTCVISVSYQISMKETHPDFYEKVEKHIEDCTRESGANKDDVEKLLDKGEFLDKEELKCFLGCIFEKTGVLNTKGEIQESGFKSSFSIDADSKKIDKIMNNCLKIQSENSCDAAYKLVKCCEENVE
ncbi:hypothetical protein RN001_002116 [Aquatica leii]|uniref:Uncharacterized protein n=1 Tax=Aquatica leii TaxID=1421715 RepID=A0AAN7QAW8_9COLE|nr:hypothetical protein RN001_002116 [Aquatica leii]